MNVIYAEKRKKRKVAQKRVGEKYMGAFYPDIKPHPSVLASIELGEPDLRQRVDDLTRLSRVRRIRPNDALDEKMFDNDIDVYDDLPDEGITPYEESSYRAKFRDFTYPDKQTSESEEVPEGDAAEAEAEAGTDDDPQGSEE